MANTWEFRHAEVDNDKTTYADGTKVPSIHCEIWRDGVEVGEVEVHMHRRAGRDRIPDTSFGFTGIIFGTPEGGN